MHQYQSEVATKAVEALTEAMQDLQDEEFANALLADPRMTNTKGILASCGFTYGEIKFVRGIVSGNIPTLAAQKRAQAFLNDLDKLQREVHG